MLLSGLPIGKVPQVQVMGFAAHATSQMVTRETESSR
jgi:hypothetical protein